MKLFSDESRHADIQRQMREALKPYQAWIDDPQCDEGLKKLLCKYVDAQDGCIPRRIGQFDSSILLVIAMGMLKAGKSTLVNLLSRNRDTSPTGYGKDTTLRPALIRMAREGERVEAGAGRASGEGGEGRIDVYFPLGTEEDLGLGKLMDYIRGLRQTPHAAPSVYPLTDENLTRILCHAYDSILPTEPLLVVVTLPFNQDCRVLQENRMLVDMPGLDSGLAVVSRRKAVSAPAEQEPPSALQKASACGGLYDAIISECDLMLFVQSSVAPLNEKASDMLQAILRKRSNTSCYIVQNTMRASYWRTEAVQSAEENEQAQHAQKMIASLLPRRSSARGVADKENPIKMSIVNLGMASDSLFAEEYLDAARKLTSGEPISRESLLRSSAFESLENNLLNEVGGSGATSRFTHCCDELWDVVERAGEAVEEQLKKLETDHVSAANRSKLWKEKMDASMQLMMGQAKFQQQGQISLKNLPTFENSRKLAREAFPEMGESRVYISTVNKYLRQIKKNCYLELRSFLAQTLSLEDVLIASGGEVSNAMKSCAAQISKAFTSLTSSELYSSLPDKVALYWGLTREGTLLHIDVDPRQEAAEVVQKIERVSELDPDGSTSTLDLSGKPTNAKFEVYNFAVWKSMKSASTVIKLKEDEYFTHFRELLCAIVADRLEALCDNIIKEGIKAGSRAYMSRLQQLVDGGEQDCSECDSGMARRHELLRALRGIQKKAELLRSLPL